MSEGVVFNIQRFSVHDGPGIRTTVFLKGCSLRCFWCHNPESWSMRPELQLFPDLCIGCGRCFRACPLGVHTLDGDRKAYDRERCVSCGACAKTCYAQALVYVGKRMPVDDALDEIRKDYAAYTESGGGVTLSGGEPLLQPEFCRDVLAQCKEEGIHTAVETAAHVNWQNIEMVVPFLDLVMLDIKAMDSARHQAATGQGNTLILTNARKIAQTGLPLIIRTPVIPGVNDTKEEIGAIARFVASLPGVQYWELLPFHKLGEGKFLSLGQSFPAADLQPPSQEQMQFLLGVAGASDVPVR